MKKTILALITATSLLTACATTSQNVSSDGLYSFPEGIQDGYWAMVGDVDGEYAVINFKGNLTHNYRFKCNAETKTYRQTEKETYTLKPTTNGMQLVYKNEPAFSTLKAITLEPKKFLIMQQTFPDKELQELLPDGLEFVYFYTPTLKPLCIS